MKNQYRVERRNDSAINCVVSANSEEEAAVIAAIRIGVRHFGTKPNQAVRSSPGSRLFSIFAPSKAMNASINCHFDVYVEVLN